MSITFEEGLEQIDLGAFTYSTGITELHFPASLRWLGDEVFMNSGLQTLTFEEGLFHIGSRCFANLNSLKELTIPASVMECGNALEYLSACTVYVTQGSSMHVLCDREDYKTYLDAQTGKPIEKSHLTTVDGIQYRVYPTFAAVTSRQKDNGASALTIPDTVEGVPVTRLEEDAFHGWGFYTVSLPDTVCYFGARAMESSYNLSQSPLSDSAAYVGADAFCGCNLPLLYLPQSLRFYAGTAMRFVITDGFVICVPGSDADRIAEEFDWKRYTLQESERVLVYGNGIYRMEEDGTLTLVFAGVTAGTFYIPDTVSGLPVTAVAPDAFRSGYSDGTVCTFAVSVNSYITELPAGLFSDPAPYAVFIPENVTMIDDALFSDLSYLPAIYGTYGTAAEVYANRMGLPFYNMETVPFRDVAENAWYYDAVRYCYWANLMRGTSATTFDPSGKATRAMIAQVLYSMSGGDDLNFSEVYGFRDIKVTDWFFRAVNFCRFYGLAYGTSEYIFSPNDLVTREQLATFLYRYAAALGCDVSARSALSAFPDGGKTSSFAVDALQWAVAEGLISGKENNGKTLLDPLGKATRVEIASLLMRFVENVLSAG